MSMLPYFPYNPFEWWNGVIENPLGRIGEDANSPEPEVVPGRWLPSEAMRQSDPWRYENWMNQNNVSVLSGNPNDGYEVMVKTGDKEGTVYHLLPDGKGGYVSREVGKRGWDTNGSFLDKWGPLLPFAGAAIAAFAPSIMNLFSAPAANSAAGRLALEAAIAGGAEGSAIGQAAGAGLAGAGAGAGTAAGAGAAGAGTAAGAGAGAGAASGAGAAAGASTAGSLVRWLAENTGLSEGAVTAIVGLTPAALSAVDHLTRRPEDNQSRVTGDPVLNEARRGLVSLYMGEFPALRQRSRDIADRMLGYASGAASIPQSLPRPRGIMEVDPNTGSVRLRRPTGLFG